MVMAWKEWIFGGPKRLGQVRWLSQLLILSGAFNIAFLFMFTHAYSKRKEEKSHYAWRAVERVEEARLLSNRQLLTQFEELSFSELVGKLSSTLPIEDGFAERDLALACLTALHHLDLERALGSLPSDLRSLKWGEERVAALYPSLKEMDWEAIRLFCQRERWPLTSQGLFLEARRQGDQIHATLAEAIFLTPQFHLAEVLLARANPPIGRLETLVLLMEGDWRLIEQYTEEQRTALDLSDGRRRRLLTDYLCHSSPLAARLLVRTDLDYAVHHLADDLVIQAVALMSTPSPEGERFALEVLAAPRSSRVWAAAAETLCRYKGQTVEVAEARNQTIHEVQGGESLWGLARKYNTSIDAIVQSNRLQGETIRPGQKLTIPQGAPQGTGS